MAQETHPLLRQLNQLLGVTERVVIEQEIEYNVYLLKENHLSKSLIGKFCNRQQLDNALSLLLMFLRLTDR